MGRIDDSFCFWKEDAARADQRTGLFLLQVSECLLKTPIIWINAESLFEYFYGLIAVGVLQLTRLKNGLFDVVFAFGLTR